MKTVTLDRFMSFHPCYSREEIEKLTDKTEMTALEVLALDIPAEDRLWAVLREDFIETPILHEFACRCAEEALKLVKNPDERSVAAIAAKRAWLKGEISETALRRARAAACAAADAAYAADAAAWAAATAAYYAAAYAAYAASAASAASADTAASAAYYAAAAFRTQQIKILIELLTDLRKENK